MLLHSINLRPAATSAAASTIPIATTSPAIVNHVRNVVALSRLLQPLVVGALFGLVLCCAIWLRLPGCPCPDLSTELALLVVWVGLPRCLGLSISHCVLLATNEAQVVSREVERATVGAVPIAHPRETILHCLHLTTASENYISYFLLTTARLLLNEL